MEHSEVDWSVLTVELERAVRTLAEGGNYDEAIFVAFKHVEAEIQERIHSRNVGLNLIAEAFDGASPKIAIGLPSDRAAVRAMFAGALGFIRNDRGHKKTPAVPCRSIISCMWFLNHAALLLYFLSKDEALRARIDTISVVGDRVQFHGVNLQRTSKVRAAEIVVQIVQISESIVEAVLPERFVGDVEIYSDGEQVDKRFCDVRSIYNPYPGVYEVMDVEVPLLADVAGTAVRPGVVGLRLRLYEAGKTYYRMSPTLPGRYKKGQFVQGTPWDMKVVVGESWYRDSTSGEIRYAWTSSALFVPDKILGAPAPQLSALLALPSVASLEPGEIITLSARGIESIGDARQEVDLTQDANWNSADPSIAFVKNGVLYAKRFGSTVVRCSAKGFQSTAEAHIENHARGDKSIFFEGLRLTTQICFDAEDNLYISNQSQRIYCLHRKGGLEVVLQMSKVDDMDYQIDCIALDVDGGLYFTAPQPRQIMYFVRSASGFQAGKSLSRDDYNVKKSIEIACDGRVVVGMMGSYPGSGYVLQIYPDGREAIFQTRESAHNLALDFEGNIYVVASNHQTIDVYNVDGTLTESINYGATGSVGTIMVDNRSIYVAMFDSGELIKLDCLNGRVERSIVARNLGNPCGMAIDSRSRLYVSDFSTGRIYIIR